MEIRPKKAISYYLNAVSIPGIALVCIWSEACFVKTNRSLFHSPPIYITHVLFVTSFSIFHVAKLIGFLAQECLGGVLCDLCWRHTYSASVTPFFSQYIPLHIHWMDLETHTGVLVMECRNAPGLGFYPKLMYFLPSSVLSGRWKPWMGQGNVRVKPAGLP